LGPGRSDSDGRGRGRARRWQPTRPRRGAPGGGRDREPATRRNRPAKATENTEPRARGDVWTMERVAIATLARAPTRLRTYNTDDGGPCVHRCARTADIAGYETAASIASFWFDRYRLYVLVYHRGTLSCSRAIVRACGSPAGCCAIFS
jgi:hypothetical protein